VLDDPDFDDFAADIAADQRQRDRAASPVAYRCFADIESKPIDWLWLGRIARGKLTMVAGNPGLGKSQLTAAIASTATTGGTWPVDGTWCPQGNVIFLNAEDDAADTIRPRLEAAGADLSRVFSLDAVRDGDTGKESAFNLDQDLSRLRSMLNEIGGAVLIVIDPITAYMGGVDSHKNADVRAVLGPVATLAADYGAAIIGVSHLNKGGGNEAMMRVMGKRYRKIPVMTEPTHITAHWKHLSDKSEPFSPPIITGWEHCFRTGDMIAAGRMLAGWTQKQLAEAARIHERSVRKWEAQPTPMRKGYALSRMQAALATRGVLVFLNPTPGVRYEPMAKIKSLRE
jgi:hypothetical protein